MERTTSIAPILDYLNITREKISFGEKLASVYLLECILGIILNALLIVSIKLGKHTSKEVHIQLINVALADILFGVATSSSALIRLNLAPLIIFPQNKLCCQLFVLLAAGLLYISTFWGAAISVERFFIVYFPLRARFYTYRKKVIVAVVVWASSIAIGFYSFSNAEMKKETYYGMSEEPRELLQCQEVIEIPQTLIYTLTLSLSAMLVIILMYTLIACKLGKRRHIGDTRQSNLSSQHLQVREH